jgi:hypothetical protein
MMAGVSMQSTGILHSSRSRGKLVVVVVVVVAGTFDKKATGICGNLWGALGSFWQPPEEVLIVNVCP